MSDRGATPAKRPRAGKAPQLNRSLQKALAVLASFSESRPEWGVSELARTMGIAKSSISTTMATLVAAGLVQQDPRTRRFQLGLRCLELGYLASSRMVLRDYAMPHLEALLGRDERIVYLAMPFGYEMLYLDALYPPKRKINFSSQGRRAPMYCTGLGKAALAHMREDFVSAYLDRVALTAYTANTISEPAALLDELARIRRRGYATDVQEREIGIQCVAAPVLAGDGSVAAAISVSGSQRAVPASEFARLGQAVIDTARSITRKLVTAGFEPSSSAND